MPDLPGTYELLAAPFEVVFIDKRNGVDIPYLSGEQVATRLNEVIGVGRWSFRILEHGYDQEADEVWALGELTAKIDGEQVVRQQFGGERIKRARRDNRILSLGDTKKAAGTDAMKKCAMLLGIGLYLAAKQQNPDGTARGWENSHDPEQPQRLPRRQRAPASPPREAEHSNGSVEAAAPRRDPNERITRLEHPLVQKVVKLKEEARERGLPLPETKLPATRQQLNDWGTQLMNVIKQDKERKGEVTITSDTPPLSIVPAQADAELEPSEPAAV